MNFIDTTVFVYSFLKTKRKLKPSEIEIKQKARKILENIDAGETALTSTVHISECINILEVHYDVTAVLEIMNSFFRIRILKFALLRKMIT